MSFLPQSLSSVTQLVSETFSKVTGLAVESAHVRDVTVAVAAILVIKKAYASYKQFSRRKELEQLAKKKRAARDAMRAEFEKSLATLLASPEGSKLTTEKKRSIAGMSGVALTAAIKNRSLTCTEIMITFIERAIQCGRQYSVVADEMYAEALAAAELVDILVQNETQQQPAIEDSKNGSTSSPSRGSAERGSLFGVPISVKDQIDYKGQDSTCGLAVRCFKPAKKDSLLVTLLKQQGAIPFVRGNVPQCLMLPESSNLVWGQSENPWDASRTPGGSSGGEGALVTFRAAPIAIGTDVGGSIRIPAHNCGVYGFKPTPQRFSAQGTAVPRPGDLNGQQIIKAVAGPLANSMEDVLAVLKAWLVPEMWNADPSVPPVPFNEDMFRGLTVQPTLSSPSSSSSSSTSTSTTSSSTSSTSPVPLRIGYYAATDGYAHVSPACERGVTEAVAALKEAGHTLVPWQPPRVEEAVILYLAILSAEGNMRGFIDGLDGEALHPVYMSMYSMANMPGFIRPIMSAILRAVGETRSANVLSNVAPKSAAQHWDDVAKWKKYCADFAAAWDAAQLDAVVCPGNVLPAMAHNLCKDILPLFSHTFLWNLVHYPTGSVPVTRVRTGEDVYFRAGTDIPVDRLSKLAHAAAAGSAGLPVNVQVAAKPFRDEVALRVMQDLENRLPQISKLVPPAAGL